MEDLAQQEQNNNDFYLKKQNIKLKKNVQHIKKTCSKIMFASIKLVLIFCVFIGCSSLRTNKNGTVPVDVAREYYLINAARKYYQGDLVEAHRFLSKSISVAPDCSPCYYLMSSVLLKAGYLSDALHTSQMAFKLDSTNFWYGKHLAQISELSGNLDLSIKTYQYLLSFKKNDEDIYFDLGSLYCRQNQFDKALELYDSLQKKIGFNEKILFAKQQVYYATNNNSTALVEALRYFENDTENPQANVLLAEVFGRAGNDSLALKYLERAHEIDETYAAPLFALAEMYREGYEYDKFFDILNKVAVNKFIPLSDKLEYFTPVLQFWQQIKYQEKVENIFTLLAENYSNDWRFKQFYASFLFQTERQNQAISIIDEELKQNKQNSSAWSMKIALLYYDNNLEKVLSAIDTALVYSREKYELLLQKSSTLYELKRYKDAIAILEKTLNTNKNGKNNNEMLAFLGDLYHAVGEKKLAYKAYEKVLEVDTANISVLNNYAYYLSEDNKSLKHALEMSKKTINAEPENATYLDTYAWILHKLGRNEEAKPVFRKAMTLGARENPVILDHYGDVLFELKEYDTAILYWEDSLSKKDVANVSIIHEKIEKCKLIKNLK
ncbi:MAG: tetratricopeptide repeat protein [Prevotellaceae bacterium]|jgi:pentatricopeptide repeat protein|nr:tetratricopeptide repeat protein [Prevotellaceae bacterium]